MREVKFRGKRKDNGEWVYGFPLIGWISGAYILAIITKAQYVPSGVSVGDKLHHYEVDPTTVGQFTGLRDKNGKEIWEGDIVEWIDTYMKQGEFIGKVSFGNGSFYIETELGGHYRWIDYEVEVIGNIHKNPKPLEAKE